MHFTHYTKSGGKQVTVIEAAELLARNGKRRAWDTGCDEINTPESSPAETPEIFVENRPRASV